MVQDNLQRLNAALSSKVSNSTLAVILDGMPFVYSGSQLFVRKNFSGPGEGKIEYSMKIKGKDKPMRVNFDKAGIELANRVYSYLFCGYDFSLWGHANSKNEVRIVANSTLNMLFIETPMHRIFREQILNRPHLNIQTTITHGSGKPLTAGDISIIINDMRVNGVNGMIALYNRSLKTRVRNHSHPFYRIGDVYTPSKILFDGFFNPFYNDKILHELLRGSRLFQAIEANTKIVTKLGIEVSLLSNYELSELLGLNNLVPFTFPSLMKLVAGQVFDPTSLPVDYPNKAKTVMVLNEDNLQGYSPVISTEEFRRLSAVEQGYYSRTNSMFTFILQNQAMYRQKGLRRPVYEIREMLDNLTIQ